MDLITIVKKLKKEDFFWRIARRETFVDILMLQYPKVIRNGLNEEVAILIIETAIKAIINDNLGPIPVESDYDSTMQHIVSDEQNIIIGIDSVLKRIQFETQSDKIQGTVQILQYFKVLSNLDLKNYDTDAFYDILRAVLKSGIIKTDMDI